MKNKKSLAAAASAATLTLLLSACGGGGSNEGGGGGPAEEGLEDRGPITYVQGKDNSGVVRPIIAKWNAEHPDEQVTFKEQTDEADQQHDDLVQNFQAQNADYDVVSVDVVWTAEFAAQGWIQPLEGEMEIDTSGMLPATVASATYQDTLYAAPQHSDGGILYYRSDLIEEPPTTWDEMIEMCSIAEENDMGCYAGQFAQYEGLTVNASEAINGAGGTVIDESGQPTLDTEEARTGLGNLVSAFEEGHIPAEAITYTEEEGRIAFQEGNLLFHRNWPYVYNLATTEESSQVKDVLGMAPLPGADGPGASSLGGHSLAISVYSDNKATARDFLEFVTAEEQQRFYVTQGSLAPVLGDLYEDEELVAELPYLPVLRDSIENAVPRPVTPFYPAVTTAIQENAYAALQGEKSVDQALTDMAASISQAGS
ncbi:extracellular solute-binding protein [Arthrobacter sp. JZ12]|uniref:ABC transporter substrate-binding protein n=1 Tax=Arthrobacter sp. JZ12 TaxID=2654190 RepID=UPI002B480313|nr:ABC transporter substrate-binding protein [Arthrobacter sp. JZ12]WRH23809.1 extracellular solute-binding protein [Arthrobacter sp. JZ12]